MSLMPTTSRGTSVAVALRLPGAATVVGGGAVLAAAVVVASLRPAFRQGADSAAQHAEALARLGLSPQGYSGYVLSLVTVLATVYLGVAVLLVRLPVPERAAATSSALVLVALGVVFPQTLPALVEGHPGRSLLLDAVEGLTVVALTSWVLTFPRSRTASSPARAAVLVVAAVELVGLTRFGPAPGGPVALVLTACWAVALVVAAAYRYRRSDVDERQRVRWVLGGLCVALTALVLASVAQSLGAVPGTLLDLVVQAGLVMAFLLVPVSVAAALVRRRLWGLPAATGRAATYALLIVPVTGTYVVAVAAVTALLPGHVTGAAAVIAGLLAIGLHPAYVAVRRAVERTLFGQPREVGTRLATLASTPEEGSDVLGAAAAIVVRTLRLPYVRVTVHADGEVIGLGSAGTEQPGWPTMDLPLHHLGQQVGGLRVGLRERDGSVDAADRDTVLGACAPIAVLAHSLRLNHQLRTSRNQLLSAREEERRRLRDDLHDELGPALGAVTLKLTAAARHLPGDPASAQRLVHEAAAQTTAAVTDVRRLIHGLRPPVLDEIGLVGAVHAYVADLGPATPAITVACPRPLPPLPAAVESAAYRVVLEAVSNVVRHAGATSCRIEIEVLPHGLYVQVADDGRGLPRVDARPGGTAGVGLPSMRDRCTELGGSISIDSTAAGGTLVRALLPLTEVSGG
jgi:signal transduction histidine kinase